MKLAKKKKQEIVQQSFGFEESRVKNFLLNLKHRFVKIGREIHYSGVYTNFWLWNIVFANVAIGAILYSIINKSYKVLPKNIGINLDSAKGYDYIIRKEVLFSPIFVHILIAIVTFLFVFRQGKKLNHLLIVMLLNTLLLAFFEIAGLNHILEYFR